MSNAGFGVLKFSISAGPGGPDRALQAESDDLEIKAGVQLADLAVAVQMSAYDPKRTSAESFAVMRKKVPQRTNSDETAHQRPHYLGCENASDRQLIWSRCVPFPFMASLLIYVIAPSDYMI